MKAFIVACVAAVVIAVHRRRRCSTACRSRPTRPSALDRRAPRRLSRSADERRVGQEADAGARLDRRHVLGKFQQPVGLGQRRQNAGAVLRMLDRLDFAVGARAAAPRARIRGDLSFSCRRRPRAPAAASVCRAARRTAGAATASPPARTSRTPRPDCPAGRRRPRCGRCRPRITPIATGRPGLMATRQNTRLPMRSTALRTWSASPVETPPEVITRSWPDAASRNASRKSVRIVGQDAEIGHDRARAAPAIRQADTGWRHRSRHRRAACPARPLHRRWKRSRP